MRLSVLWFLVGAIVVAPLVGCSSTAGSSGALQDDAVSSTTSVPSAGGSLGASPGTSAPAELMAAGSCDGVSVPCAIGDTGPGGGVVFYDAGSPQEWGQYLEAAPAGWNGGGDPRAPWCQKDASVDTGEGIGTGAENTRRILALNCGKKVTAAAIAAGYRGGAQADWFLPSKDELNALYTQRNMVGGLAADYFWSSSQYSSNYAWLQWFVNGAQYGLNEYNGTLVRPVRAF